MHPFRYKGFLALWSGALISNIGGWMSTVALGVTVTEQTGRAAWTGTVAAMMFVPSVVLAPVAGALADRFDRRRYLFLLNCVQMCIAAVLATMAFTGSLTPRWMALLALLTGIANTLGNPAFVATIVELVPTESLAAAFSLNSAQFNLGRIIGPALATAVFAIGGPPWAFVANSLSFLAVLAAIALLPPWRRPAPVHEGRPLLADVRDGVLAARNDPGIRFALLLVLLIAIFVAPFIGLVPVYAMKVFGKGAETASLFTTSQGIGAVVAALAMGLVVGRLGMRRSAALFLLLLGPVCFLYWLAPSPGWAVAGIACLGGVYLASLTALNTIEQVRAHKAFQARISSMHSMMLGGGYAIGLISLGWLSDQWGVRGVLLTASALFIGAVAALRLFVPRLWERLEVPTARVTPRELEATVIDGAPIRGNAAPAAKP